MSDEESNEHAAEDSEQSDEQLLANEQSQESEASEKSAERSQEQLAESDQWTSSLRDPQNPISSERIISLGWIRS